MGELFLALDIGGTKLAGGLVDRDGAVVHQAVTPTPTVADPEAIWAALDGLIIEQLTMARGKVCGVGVGSAGPIDLAAGTVRPLNIPSWSDPAAGAPAGGFPLRDRVAAAVPNVPVRLAMDAVCMALGEAWCGAGAGTGFLLGMVVSTGVGGGLVLDGRPYGGRTGNAGHVGHVVVEPDGPACACGGRGCVEAIASGPRMVRWAREHGWAADPGADAAALAAAALAGDQVAAMAFERGGRAVGRMIASVAAVCDLELAVVGGGVAKAGPLLFDPIAETVATHARLDYLRGLRVVAPGLGDASGLVGAAALIAVAGRTDTVV